jgi:hypothetical protein
MLALHHPRCLLHSSRLVHVRTLRTLPRPIPDYIKRWDPTLHIPTRERLALLEDKKPRETSSTDSSTRAKQVRQVLSCIGSKSEPITANAPFHKLKHLFRLAKARKIDHLGMRRPLWRAYKFVKYADGRLLSSLHSEEWDLLWKIQGIKTLRNERRALHLEELYSDMVSAGIVPSKSQRIDYLECLFLNGKDEQAIQEWETDDAEVQRLRTSKCEPEHLDLGVRLHAFAGSAARAQKIMDRLFEGFPNWDPMIMLHILRAYTSSDEARHHAIAYRIYGQMKDLLGLKMTIKDYDACLMGFLEAKNETYAMLVFGDMVRDGHLATAGSTKHVEAVLERLHMLYRLGTHISTMTSIALDAIKILPESYHGHVFGDWMKQAVVQQEPMAAAKILDMMFECGHTPETFHFNMLLKALLRTKESPNILKAENIGWQMIDQARQAHKRKLNRGSNATQIREKKGARQREILNANRKVPAADITTFALIMQHHAKSLQWEHVDYLARQLKESSMPPNDTIMNVLMDNKIRQGAYAKAWSIYKQHTSPTMDKPSTRVFPNGASIRHLWVMLRLALGDGAARDDPTLPSPRELLKETVQWWMLCRSRYDAERFRTGAAGSSHGAITPMMLHCFSYTQDLPGALIVLHVLRHKFDIFPREEHVEVLQRQIAWTDLSGESEETRAQHYHAKSYKRNLERTSKIYNILLEQRFERLGLSEERVADMTEEEIGDYALNLLSEFVRVVLKRANPPEVVEAMIEAARLSIGCPDLPTGDMDAFEVA